MIYASELNRQTMNPAVKQQIAVAEYIASSQSAYEAPLSPADIPAPVDGAGQNEAASNKLHLPYMPLSGIMASSVNMCAKPDEAKEFVIAKENAKIRFYHICPSLEEAVKLDQFFDMYGYATNAVKVPNEDSRESWNYVKTDNVIINGSMPVQDMAVIKAMYNRGVRFWHTADVGNYSLSNRDMKEVVKDDVS